MLSMRCRRGSEGRSDRKMRRRAAQTLLRVSALPWRLWPALRRSHPDAQPGDVGGHRAEFIASLGDAFDLASRGCFAWCVQNRAAFILDPACPPAFATSRELEEIRQFSLGVVAAHGVVDAFASTGTDISFAGVAAEHPLRSRTSRSTRSRRCFTLFLATEQVARSPIDLARLTDRQRQLVDLALMGLSDKTIATRLGISEKTVGNHFRGMYKRLGISKRS
jgi:DNA-binding CsgD family transcriptional regulator